MNQKHLWKRLGICAGIIIACAIVHVGIAAYNYPNTFTAVPLWMVLALIIACWAAVLLVCLAAILLISKYLKK